MLTLDNMFSPVPRKRMVVGAEPGTTTSGEIPVTMGAAGFFRACWRDCGRDIAGKAAARHVTMDAARNPFLDRERG